MFRCSNKNAFGEGEEATEGLGVVLAEEGH